VRGSAADLYRFDGTAVEVAGSPKASPLSVASSASPVSWSLILKAFRPPSAEKMKSNGPSDWNYWRREADLYQSGFLGERGGSLCAPKCAGVVEQTDGSVWVWMQTVTESAPQRWPLSRHALAARHFGQLNGVYLSMQPKLLGNGFSQAWLRSWAENLGSWLEKSSTDAWDLTPLGRPLSHTSAERVMRLAHSREALLARLELLPSTVCHLDGWRSNLFASLGSGGAEQTIAVDWMFTGIAALGEEPAGIVGADLWPFVVEPEDAATLEEAVLDGYIAGLRDAGWRGDAAIIRFGYAVALALRFGLLIPRWFPALREEEERDWLERKFGRPVPHIADGWRTLLRFFLDRADEAYAQIT
jgi:hypothetical protein